MSLLWFILIIGIAIFVHELGHYWAAKAQGVGVKTFALGFGPRLLAFRWRDTDWRLNLIPLGGYAEIDGMQELSGVPPHGYARLSIPGKLLVLVGGVVMNLLLAWVLLATVFATEGVPRGEVDNSRAIITQVTPGSLAERIGLRPGDIITAINGNRLSSVGDITRVRQKPGAYTFTVERGKETLEVPFTWTGTPQDRIGIGLAPYQEFVKLPFWKGLLEAPGLTLRLIPQFFSSLVRGVGGAISGNPSGDVAGPVGIAVATGEAARQGLTSLLTLAAGLNLSLAIFNLLPIPILDGGRILFVLLGGLLGLFGRRIRPEQEAYVNYLGLAFLLFLFVLFTFNDIRRLIGG